jgi:hypothetical protein
LSKLTLEQAASQFAWTLGHDDYPLGGRCPYHSVKSRALHDAYWKGWHVAAEKVERDTEHAEKTAA